MSSEIPSIMSTQHQCLWIRLHSWNCHTILLFEGSKQHVGGGGG
jgi:hypothetical protein